MSRRRSPRLVLVLPLEQRGRVYLVADSREDEQRLRQWLRRTRELDATVASLARLLDDLDENDRRSAA